MTNNALVSFCLSKLGTAYVYGCKGEVLTQSKYTWLKKMYGKYIFASDVNKIGKECVDCSGLISWCTGIEKSSTMYRQEAKSVHSISTIDSAPIGAAVWRQGHIGIYIGNRYCVEARGSAYGVVLSKLSERQFTHWFLLNDVQYVDVEYYPAYTGKSISLVDALRSMNIDSSIVHRRNIAYINGITTYSCSAEQNIRLLNLLKQGQLIAI